jgi:hypothetical protein
LHRLGFICAGVWLMWTASVMIRLHPYEHLFFNPLVGGLAGADQRYDTDYWVNVMREAVDSLETYLDRERPQALPYRVAVCGEGVPFDHAAARRHRLQLAVGDENADFFIAPTHMHCDRAIDGVVVARIQRMGTVIGVVKDRRAHIETTLAGGH